MKKPAVGETDKLRTLTEDPELRALMEKYDERRPASANVFIRLHPSQTRTFSRLRGTLERALRDGDLKAIFNQP